MSTLSRLVIYFSALLCYSAIAGCGTSERDYDGKIYELVKKANSGDTKSAKDAYDYCTAYLKLDDIGLPSIYMGRCGGIVAIWRDAAMQSGDPEQIMDVLKIFETAPPDYKRHIPDYYFSAAKTVIVERCNKDGAPAGCKNRDTMRWFGLAPIGPH